jgi:hypothetical protein
LTTSPDHVEAIARPSATWAPLRRRGFRALWIAQFASNTGTWAQTVGAQWLMGDLGGGALQVALVQTATTLPVFLLVLPAGALGDILDRRRLLLTGQLSAAAQVALPDWARARALAYFQLVFMGGQALGAVMWGGLASAVSLRAACVAPAAGLVAGALLGFRRLALHADELDVRHTQHLPEPIVGYEPPADAGPVLVTVEWLIVPGCQEAFAAAMQG